LRLLEAAVIFQQIYLIDAVHTWRVCDLIEFADFSQTPWCLLTGR
jgi:hypothetical protein